MKFIIQFFLILLLLLPAVSFSHHKPMIDKEYPTAPPTIDPGPDAAIVFVTILDSEQDKPINATVSVNQGEQESALEGKSNLK